MSRHDETEESTEPMHTALAGDDEPTGLIAHVPNDLRRSASLILGDDPDEEDVTAPTRVRNAELRAAIASPRRPHSAPAREQARPEPTPAPAPHVDAPTEINVVRTADLEARAPSPLVLSSSDNPFSEDEPTHALASRVDLHAAAIPAPSPVRSAPRPQANPLPRAAPVPRPDPTRARPRHRDDEPVGLAAEASWTQHVDDTPIARPRRGPPTGFGPAIQGPTRHPGAPVDKGDMSHDTLIKQQLAEIARPLTDDERDAVTNNMLMIGAAIAFVLSFLLFATGASTVWMLLVFVPVIGGMGALSRKFPDQCASFLSVLSIKVRKE